MVTGSLEGQTKFLWAAFPQATWKALRARKDLLRGGKTGYLVRREQEHVGQVRYVDS